MLQQQLLLLLLLQLLKSTRATGHEEMPQKSVNPGAQLRTSSH
jgi:hypothetical protein